MKPEQYDAWYATQRGAWIGGEEYRLLDSLLAPTPGETLLDVGCGTGYFTRRFAANLANGNVVGADIDPDMLRFADGHSDRSIGFVAADARQLPFRDKSFDLVVSVTALCFIQNEKQALSEMLRVARRRVVLGLLNRHSLLHFSKGRNGGLGAYRGARWHTHAEALRLFNGLPMCHAGLGTVIVMPGGKRWSRRLEPTLRRWLPGCGAFIAVAADVLQDQRP
ncbi:malonyl-[acyl-carrier protein] O-methyltransferase [mine drainage metagenome]|uniref:Malonyl-[acyl-carrier protein] O-methyltransferase n=1 Tax=mine drainage metagenome TaxID=410659 RepID=A0A1J5S340_9ZZZZ